jgi:hypothetical protein
LIWSAEWYLVRSKGHEAPRYVVFSNPLLTRACQAWISYHHTWGPNHKYDLQVLILE